MIQIFSDMTSLLGIDLGSAFTRVWHSREGFLPTEASVIAIDQDDKVVAVGNDAKDMMGKVGKKIKVFEPIRGGEMVDIEVTKAFLIVLLKKVFKIGTFFRPVVMISVPASFSSSEREITSEIFYQVGASHVFTISQPLAAAIGAGVPIADASGTFITHLGKSRVEVGTISLGSLVSHLYTRQAGEYFDHKLNLFFKKRYGMNLGEKQIFRVKSQLFDPSLVNGEQALEMTVSGQDIKTNQPLEKAVSLLDAKEEGLILVGEYQKMINQLLSSIPPDFTSDILDKGMLLTGGMAQMRGLDLVLSELLNIPVSLVDESDKVVIKGISIALENIEEFSKSLGYKIN